MTNIRAHRHKTNQRPSRYPSCKGHIQLKMQLHPEHLEQIRQFFSPDSITMSLGFPLASPLLCQRCIEMTSTMSGLKELASKEGYKHLFLQELIESAKNGCPLCIFLHRSHESDLFPDAYVRVFARCPILQEHEAEAFKIQSESKGHPFEVSKLNYLRSALLDDEVKLDSKEYNPRLARMGSFSYFHCFTSAGTFVLLS